jgi:hypothetical protein
MDIMPFLEGKLLDVCSSIGQVVSRNVMSLQIWLKRFPQFDQKNIKKA